MSAKRKGKRETKLESPTQYKVQEEGNISPGLLLLDNQLGKKPKGRRGEN